MSGKDWHIRPFRVKVGLGTGKSAGTFETVLVAPEWMGQFGSLAADELRRKNLHEHLRSMIAARFPGEKVVMLEFRPIAAHVRQRWDRP